MNKYNVILFDLDHTLWDYEKNSLETLNELYDEYSLVDLGILNFNQFTAEFNRVNERLWANYNKGHINRETINKERFFKILKTFNVIDRNMSKLLSDEYIFRCPTKTHLFPHTFETLDYLKDKYDLYLLTNGFNDIQEIKLTCSKLKPYFKGVVTSETSGHRKPSKEIFDYTLSLAGANSSEAIMVGDNLNADIAGARKANIDTVYFNPAKLKHQRELTFEINCLSELHHIL